MRLLIGFCFWFLSSACFCQSADYTQLYLKDISYKTSLYSHEIAVNKTVVKTEKDKKEKIVQRKKERKKTFPKGFVPEVETAVIKERLARLEKSIPLIYHDKVEYFIKKYLVDYRNQTQIFLQKKDNYFPIFEKALKKYQLPDEIKYLSIIESALIPDNRSWAGAVGLWQFMPATGKIYGLKQNWYMDERVNPYLSTEAACKYLKVLYNMFDDWHLALAAYNCGPGYVQRAIKRSGSKADFWEIYEYLPKETRSYVPAFIAMNYIMNYYHEHNLDIPDYHKEYIEVDTVYVSQYVNLHEFAKQLDLPFELIKTLNPQFTRNVVPAYVEGYPLFIPHKKSGYYLAHEKEILSASLKQSNYALASNQQNNQNQATHIIQRGESLGLIAKKYGVQVHDLKKWNQLSSNLIYPGQKLYIHNPKEKKPNNKLPDHYVVQKGDTLWSISNRFHMDLDQIKKINGLESDALQIGQKLKFH